MHREGNRFALVADCNLMYDLGSEGLVYLG